MGYEDGTKGYRIWLTTEKKIVISKDVIFNEQRFFKDLEKESISDEQITEPQKDKGKKKVSFKNHLMKFEDESSSSGGADSGVSDQPERSEQGESSGTTSQEESAVSDDEVDTDPEQTEDLGSYVLARDRERRTIRPPSKFEDADFLAYALASAEDLETEEPKSYKEAKQSKQWKLWDTASDEEMESRPERNRPEPEDPNGQAYHQPRPFQLMFLSSSIHTTFFC